MGTRGILRNYKWDLIYAFATSLGVRTNNDTRILAETLGITWYIQCCYSRLILEIDLEFFVKWLKQ